MSLKVAIAGATGNLGPSIVNALLAANLHVTILTRKGSKNASKLQHAPNISIVEVDYSASPLVEALKGHAVVVSTLPRESLGAQAALIDAAITAGVTRFIPSEFGRDTSNPKTARLPISKGKIETQQYIKHKVAEHPGFTYTLIFNGAFLDWGLEAGFIANLRKHTATVYNGGNVKFSATNLNTIGAAVVGVIKNLPETANRPIYIHDAVITQNQLIQYAKEKDGVEWTITHKDTSEVCEESFAELAKGQGANVIEAKIGFIITATFGEGYGGDYSGHVNNDIVGLPHLTDAQVRKQVEDLLPGTSS